MTDHLDRALATLEWAVHTTNREQLLSGQPLRRGHPASGFVYISTGRIRLTSEGSGPLELAAGDLVFFPRKHATNLVAQENVELLDVGFEPTLQRQSVADTLPEVLYVKDFASQERSMVALIEGMGHGGHRLGGNVICNRIATTIVSAALRSWNEAGCAPQRWLDRISDPYIADVLDAVHAEPGRAWTLEELARSAAMSRTTFSARFRHVVGHTPYAYLTNVRMETAMGLMLTGSASVAEMAGALGYSSEEGFSRAFHRHTGTTPSRWRAEQSRSTTPARQTAGS